MRLKIQMLTIGLFGKIEKFPNIEIMPSIEKVNNYIKELANKKVPIFRCTISLSEYDAIRLGYYKQEKWKELFESKLISFADKLNIKYGDIQYCRSSSFGKWTSSPTSNNLE